LTANGLGCPGGGAACIIPSEKMVTDDSITTPAIDVVIDFPAVSITGFTQMVRILPRTVHGHAIMRWQ